MENYTYIRALEAEITAEAKAKGLKQAVADYLQDVEEQLPDETFPSGLNVADTVEIIFQTAENYVGTRIAQQNAGKVLTVEDVRSKIGENLSGLTMNQAKAYLVQLQLVYKCFAADGLNSEQLTEEYEAILASVAGKGLQEQVDELVDTLDVEQANRFLDVLDDRQQEVTDTEAVQDIAAKLSAEYAAFENVVIRGAVIYGEAVLGNIEEMDPAVNSGIVTAQAAAYTDAAVVASKMESGEITEEEAEEVLGRIGTALAAALAIAVFVFMLYGSYVVAMHTGYWVLNQGANALIATVISDIVLCLCGGAVFYEGVRDDDDDLYSTIYNAILHLKKWWNAHVAERYPSLYICSHIYCEEQFD